MSSLIQANQLYPSESDQSQSPLIQLSSVLNSAKQLQFLTKRLLIVYGFLAALLHFCLCNMRGLLRATEGQRGLHGEGQK